MSDTPKQAAIKELRGKYPLSGVEKCHYCAEYHRKDEPCCAMAELALKDEQIAALKAECEMMRELLEEIADAEESLMPSSKCDCGICRIVHRIRAALDRSAAKDGVA